MLSFRKGGRNLLESHKRGFPPFLRERKEVDKNYFLTGRTIYLFSLIRVWEEKSWLESIHVFSGVVHCRLKFCTDHCRDRNCQESFSPSEEIEEGRKKSRRFALRVRDKVRKKSINATFARMKWTGELILWRGISVHELPRAWKEVVKPYVFLDVGNVRTIAPSSNSFHWTLSQFPKPQITLPTKGEERMLALPS